MHCNLDIHTGLIDDGEVMCPFCDEQIRSIDTKNDDLCCGSKEIITDYGINICINCGTVIDYELVGEYIDFYRDRYKIRTKSIYQRKYHLETLLIKFNLQFIEWKQILLCFKQVENALTQLEQTNKRFPILDYLLYKILQLKHSENKHGNYEASMVKCTRYFGEKTFQKYERLWKKVCDINNWKLIPTKKYHFIQKK